MKVTLIAITEPVYQDWNQESVIEHAARTCYHSQDKMNSNSRFINSIVSRGHLSVVEHVNFTFEITGITRATANQLVRHRLASYSQESTRYCDMVEQNIIEPEAIKENPFCHIIWINAIRVIKNAYKVFIDHDIKKEDARSILPLNLETNLVMTVNARELMHIIELRTSQKAQSGIRELAKEMLKIAETFLPQVFKHSQKK